jgi:Fe-Mn family superoxide dismutase
MNKREFLKTAGVLSTGLVLSPLLSCATNAIVVPSAAPLPGPTGFELPALGYAYNALEPHIDAQTMEIHHTKHHAAYVTNLNKAITDKREFAGKSIEQLCAEASAENAAVRNNGGGHYNHSKFWKWIAPGGNKTPNETLLNAINAAFGSYEEFTKQFSDAAKSRFGSGWAWLCVGADKKLFVTSTPNQDNPLMLKLTDKPGTPILGLDVWEHAYYLKYHNKRPDYVSAFWSIVNWTNVEQDFVNAMR